MNKSVALIFIYKFIEILITPFRKTEAYELGIIDDEGNVLKKQKELKTDKERNASDLLTRMVWKIKRLLNKSPGGKFLSYASALWLIRESFNECDIKMIEKRFSKCIELDESKIDENELTESGFYDLKCDIYDIDDIECLVSENRKIFVFNVPCGKVLNQNIYEAIDPGTYRVFYVTRDMICEDVSANSVGTGNIAGTVGDPPVPEMLGCGVFKIDLKRMIQAQWGKRRYDRYKTHLGSDSIAERIRQYGRRYSNKGIILQDENNNSMLFFRRNKRHREINQ